jgi:isochorismate pyruvate lyase
VCSAKTPEACESIQDVRAEIDHIDHEIITLLGRRYEYVQVAAKFKTDEASVKAPDRVAAMLQQRRAWAKEVALDPEVVVKLYTDLVQYFVQREIEKFKSTE